jgi:hypothetical protein
MNTSLNTKTNMKLCECYKLKELKEKYPNDMEFGREARKLTVDGRLGKLITETRNDLELGRKLREEKI